MCVRFYRDKESAAHDPSCLVRRRKVLGEVLPFLLGSGKDFSPVPRVVIPFGREVLPFGPGRLPSSRFHRESRLDATGTKSRRGRCLYWPMWPESGLDCLICAIFARQRPTLRADCNRFPTKMEQRDTTGTKSGRDRCSDWMRGSMR